MISLFRGLLIGLSFASSICRASPYIEAGTSIGSVSNATDYFGFSSASSFSSPFIGSMNFYMPVTKLQRWFHVDLGLHNRVTMGSGADGTSLALATSSIAARLEISRIYVGAGYAPLAFASKSSGGVSSLHLNSSASAYFFEGGAIWRVIPEFQIVAVYGMEFGKSPSGTSSPTITEYGLRFRFPFSAQEYSKASGVKFDGFRYPFGVMK